MVLDARLPVGSRLADGAILRGVRWAGPGWEIYDTDGFGRALVVDRGLARRWLDAGLLDEYLLQTFNFGTTALFAISCGPSQTIAPVADSDAPSSKSEALAFAYALRETRGRDPDTPLQDAIYVEKVTRLLPTYTITSRTQDDLVFGFWLTGGAYVGVTSFRRLQSMLTWLGPPHLRDVVMAAGFDVPEVVPGAVDSTREATRDSDRPLPADSRIGQGKSFQLPGRPELEAFLNEHVIAIVRDRDTYRHLGVEFPSGIVLHGPPGTGKTFAIERLVEFLGWPSIHIDASTIGSPYIHETGRKISAAFEQAIDSRPSVLVIDEMDAFLAERDNFGGQHRVEEIAEFLRWIPEASKNDVLVIAMTNRIDLIDEAVLRRGRFDHVIELKYPAVAEMRTLLESLLATIPHDDAVDVGAVAQQLADRPLADAAFVVREAARLAAKAGRDRLDQDSLIAALSSTPRRARGDAKRRIGFV